MKLFPETSGEVVREAGQRTGRNQVKMQKFQADFQLSLTSRGTPPFVLSHDKGTGTS